MQQDGKCAVKKTKPSLALQLLVGLLVGFANGLFGAGGGILAVVALELLFAMDSPKAHATALLIMLPLTGVSLIVYLLSGSFDWHILPGAALGMTAGSFAGARLLGRIPRTWLERIFFVLMLFTGARMVFG